MTDSTNRQAFRNSMQVLYNLQARAPVHTAGDKSDNEVVMAIIVVMSALGEAFIDVSEDLRRVAAAVEQIEMNTRTQPWTR